MIWLSRLALGTMLATAVTPGCRLDAPDAVDYVQARDTGTSAGLTSSEQRFGPEQQRGRHEQRFDDEHHHQACEACDRLDLAGESCPSFGFDAGALACAPDCAAFDTSGCGSCGNAAVEAGGVGARPVDLHDLDDEDYPRSPQRGPPVSS